MKEDGTVKDFKTRKRSSHVYLIRTGELQSVKHWYEHMSWDEQAQKV